MSKSPNCQQCEIVNHVKLSNCQNVRMSKSPNCQQCKIVKMSKCHHVRMSECQNVKMSNCQSNCQIVTISDVIYYQSVQINLAHRLCTDFQYFYLRHNKIKLAAKIICQMFMTIGEKAWELQKQRGGRQSSQCSQYCETCLAALHTWI